VGAKEAGQLHARIHGRAEHMKVWGWADMGGSVPQPDSRFGVGAV